MPPRKRQRVEKPAAARKDAQVAQHPEDDTEFVVRHVQPPRQSTSKKRKRGGPPSAAHYQDFTSFHPRLNTGYTVTMRGDKKAWMLLKRYTKFQITSSEGTPMQLGQVIFVKQDQDGDKFAPAVKAEDKDENANDWVAKVLDCRAADEMHVYLLVAWMYRPEDMPGGRQPHHGRDEVIATNDLQVIDAMTVNGQVEDLQYLDENNDSALKEGYEDLVWRQTYDVRNKTASKLRRYCICNGFANPDIPLVHCEKCKKWMHPSCIVDAAEQGSSKGEVLPPSSTPTAAAADASDDQANIKDLPNGTAKSKGLFASITGVFRGTPPSSEPEPKPASQATSAPNPPASPADAGHAQSSAAKSPGKGKGKVDRTARLIGFGGEGDKGPLRLEITTVGKGQKRATKTWEETVACLHCGAKVE